MLTEDEQLDIANEGFGSFDNKHDKIADVTGNEDADERKRYRESDFNEAGVVATSRRVSFKPLLGLFNQEKLLPLRYCPLQIELELVNFGDDAVIAGSLGGYNYGSVWDITDIKCKCDLLTLDNALENEYASHMLSGKNIPINFSTWNHTNQATNSDKDFSAHISRALTRLKSVFLTLHHTTYDAANYKEANSLYHPMGGAVVTEEYRFVDEHQVWLQIGSQQIHEYPIY